VVSAIEHDAVLAPAKLLEAKGARVTRVAVNSLGQVDPHDVFAALSQDTVLVSVQYANNEVGTVEPLREIAKLIRKWKKDNRDAVRSRKPTQSERYPLFHSDAVQAANYLELNVPTLGVDLMTLSAGKIYGPKGIGLLYRATHVPLLPIIVGGGQEMGVRAGTEHVANIIGFSAALTLAAQLREGEHERLSMLRDRLIERLEKEVEGVIINGDRTHRLPNNVHFSLPHIDHEYLAILLDSAGFAVATKSACNEHDAETSHVLLAMREAGDTAMPTSGIRVTLGRATTKDELDRFVEALKDIRARGLLLESE
jgi:cysteine desulfurase